MTARLHDLLARLFRRRPRRVPGSLDDAIGQMSVRDEGALEALRQRLQAAAQGEWATRALIAFDADPYKFLDFYACRRIEQLETDRDLIRAAMGLWERT